MVKFLLFYAVLLLFFICTHVSSASYTGKNVNGVEIYKIDMKLPPKDRFKDVGVRFKTQAQSALNFYKAFVPQPIMWVIEQVLKLMHFTLDDYY
jgi:hypothetical protein